MSYYKPSTHFVASVPSNSRPQYAPLAYNRLFLLDKTTGSLYLGTKTRLLTSNLANLVRIVCACKDVSRPCENIRYNPARIALIKQASIALCNAF